LKSDIDAPKKEVSIKLQNLLEEVNQSFGHAKEVIMDVYTQALAEGFTPKEAKNLLLSSVKTVSPRTIYYYLPAESKDEKMQQLGLKKRSLQSCNDKEEALSSELLDSNKSSLIEEEKIDTFMDNLRKELDSRKITKEIYSLSALSENKDINSIIKPIQERRGLVMKSIIILSEKHAEYVSDKLQNNKAIGRHSNFKLEHDGDTVTAVLNF